MSTGNAIGDYDTEAAALAVVRDTAMVHGRDSVRTFALVGVNRRGRATTIAAGDDLAARALAGHQQAAPATA